MCTLRHEAPMRHHAVFNHSTLCVWWTAVQHVHFANTLTAVASALSDLGIAHNETLQVVAYQGWRYLWTLSPSQTSATLAAVQSLAAANDSREVSEFVAAAAQRLQLFCPVDPQVDYSVQAAVFDE
jgi:hypothetical protein